MPSSRKARRRLAGVMIGFLALQTTPVRAIVAGQTDDFQATTGNWAVGAPDPNKPTLIATGGPAGAGDGYLQIVSTGGGGAGSRLVIFNSNQWAGDYVAAGVNAITTNMANFGSNQLFMRIALSDNSGNEFASTDAVTLPADGLWHAVAFNLNATDLTALTGGSDLNASLADVSVLRILSAASGPTFDGDPVAATLGLDNIHAAAAPEPAAGLAFLVAVLALPRARRVRR